MVSYQNHRANMVRMMGLSSQRAALLAYSAARKKPSAPRLLLLPTKPAALWGLLLSWVQVRIMQKKHLSLRGAFLVRMMGLEPTGYCYH